MNVKDREILKCVQLFYHIVSFEIRLQPLLADVNWTCAGAVRLQSEMQVNPGQLSDYPACPTIQPVRLSDRTVCQTRPFWSWPSQPREINTGTMTSGSGGAKFATGEDLRGTSLCGRIFPALVEISRMKPNLWFQMGFTFLQ